MAYRLTRPGANFRVLENREIYLHIGSRITSFPGKEIEQAPAPNTRPRTELKGRLTSYFHFELSGSLDLA